MKNRIALKLLAYFAAALLLFALVSGVLFRALFTRQTMETKKAEMLARATSLADTLSGLLAENGESGRMGGNQGAGAAGGGYGTYVRLLGMLETDVWVLDENLAARRFYEKLGFVHDGVDKEIKLGKALRECRYRIRL